LKKKNILERNLSKVNKWDCEPTKEYFDELKRVSKNYIIWGGNYFADKIGKSTFIIVWDKETGSNPFADGEIAFTSFPSNTLRIIKHQWCGVFKDSERGIQSIHPTQKPIKIYEHLLNKHAKPNDKILDTHLGSGSSRIAAYKLGFDFYSTELDKDYFEAQEKRFKEAIAQPLFDNQPLISSTQTELFG
jgi:site-specific DNA-methyltransferase (adenine-specific)